MLGTNWKEKSTKIIKKARRKRIVTYFGNMTMLEDESIFYFRGKIYDISNES